VASEQTEFASSFLVNDFWTKKQAIMKGLGYGWLPEYMIATELKNKILKPMNTEIENTHELRPKLFHRPEEKMGRTAKQLLKLFK
jgi:DNA-binding transcriptional LysR family regulator